MPSSKKTNRNSRITGEELLKFRCTGCGTCCRLWIPVTDADVRRLTENTELTTEKIVQFVKPSEYGGSPGVTIWVRFGPRPDDRRVMCVRETWNKCLFLKKNRCVVYEHRPIVCREHPFVIYLDDSERTIESLELSDVCECSHTLDGKIGKRQLKTIYRWTTTQDEDYLVKVRHWNRRKNRGTERDFLAYLGLLE